MFIGTCKHRTETIVIKVTTDDVSRSNGNIYCIKCGRLFQFSKIEAKVSSAKCGSKCTDAIRGKCVCECGGTNHAATFGVFEREG